jgi:2-methylcitrate dehydratase PrpD
MSSQTERVTHEASIEELAGFVADLEYADVPADARRLAERCFVDTVGVTYAGMVTGAGETATRAMGPVSGDGPVTLLGGDGTASVTDGAFMNGAAGHGLDFDDVSDGVNGHPSVTLVAPLLAVGEAEGASGEDLLTGFVAGFEVECYLAQAVRPGHYEAGWHPTSTMGTFGSAAAVANLLDLDADATERALNSAASMAAGLKNNFGSMTKPMHVGHAVRAGVTAAMLASEGFTSGADAIDGDQGFLDLYSGPEPPHPEDSHTPGETWAITEFGVGVKKYPCCYFTHTGITAASRLVEEHDIEPEDVESVHVVASRGAGDALKHEDPDSGLEGKFSMHYTIASAVARDRVGLDAFEDGNVDDPEVQRVRERVTFEEDPDLDYGSYHTTVAIETGEGEHSMTLGSPPGTHQDPLSDDELREKFLICVTRAESRDRAEELYEAFDSLRELEEVRGLW